MDDKAHIARETVRPRVIVVDDHAAMLQLVSRLLDGEFTIVELISQAEPLLDRWRHWRPDVIVLDISLRDRSGLDVAAELREAACAVPVVFLTCHEEPEIVEAAWVAGAAGYVVKRSIAGDLVPALRAALSGRRFISAVLKSPA
jgi:DNA-binding NarL/FixJ family response regulator